MATYWFNHPGTGERVEGSDLAAIARKAQKIADQTGRKFAVNVIDVAERWPAETRRYGAKPGKRVFKENPSKAATHKRQGDGFYVTSVAPGTKRKSVLRYANKGIATIRARALKASGHTHVSVSEA